MASETKFLNTLKTVRSSKIFYVSILALFLIPITFSKITLSFSTGIDESLPWVFNYFFHNGLSLGKDIIFPHGPLAFLMYPLPDNFLIALLAKIFLQVFLISNIYNLTNAGRKNNWILPLLVSYVLLVISNLNLLVLINVSLVYLLYFETQKGFYKYSGFLLVAFALFIKAYIAIISGIITVSFLAITLYKNRKILKSILDIAIICSFIILIWFLMYGSLAGIVKYFIGMMNLAGDNSSAVSYYPWNNWFYLTIFLIIILSVPFIQKHTKGYLFGMLFLLSVFAAWKHGMAREDIYHMKGFFFYLISLMIIFLIYIRKNVVVNLSLITIALFLLFLNLQNSVLYSPIKFQFIGINNFIELFMDYPNIKNKAVEKSFEDISKNRLPKEVLEIIKSDKVDIYPCDYSIIPANNLNWQPRPVIQSYAVYTSWLDKQNADHFNSSNAPEFFVWDIEKMSTAYYESKFESIDKRYLLNDEPQSIIQILRNYKLIFKDKKWLVYQKRNIPLKVETKTRKSIIASWNEWISVPENHHDLTRAKVKFKNTLLRGLKSFFYKDEQFYIYLKLTDGSIYKYKIVPKNTVDGIWINPLIINNSDKGIADQVSEILFKSSNQKIMHSNIELSWEFNKFIGNDKIKMIKYPNSFFGNETIISDSIIVNSTNNFERSYNNWSKIDSTLLTPDSFEGNTSAVLNPDSYSSTFIYDIDSLKTGEILIRADCWTKDDLDNKVKFVISIETYSENKAYKRINASAQAIDPFSWNAINTFLKYKNTGEPATLKVYLWNTGYEVIYYDNFEVKIIEI